MFSLDGSSGSSTIQPVTHTFLQGLDLYWRRRRRCWSCRPQTHSRTIFNSRASSQRPSELWLQKTSAWIQTDWSKIWSRRTTGRQQSKWTRCDYLSQVRRDFIFWLVSMKTAASCTSILGKGSLTQTTLSSIHRSPQIYSLAVMLCTSSTNTNQHLHRHHQQFHRHHQHLVGGDQWLLLFFCWHWSMCFLSTFPLMFHCFSHFLLGVIKIHQHGKAASSEA